MKSKVHRARVTECNLHYHGSLTLDPELIERADLVPYERVEVYNVTTGGRFATYVISGEAGRREVVVNGAAARRAHPGDLVIICSYAEYDDGELAAHAPSIVHLDEDNRIVTPPARRTVPTTAVRGASPR